MQADNWGHAGRIGVFIVGVEAVPEAEWWAMAPPGVSIHAARVSTPAPWAVWDDARGAVTLVPDVARGAEQFAGMALSATVIAHSSSSIAGGEGWDAATIAALRAVLRPETQVTTNGLDCVAALKACGVSRPFLVFPPWFGDSALPSGAAYTEAHGLAPAGWHRQDPGPKWAGTPPGRLYPELMHMEQDVEALHGQILANCPADADGVLIVGTGLRCVGLIDPLETALGRPVVTANQASLWRCLALSGVDARIEGYGQLLRG